MGTRHLIIIYHDGKYKLAQYGQWDGYPEGQGLTVLRFLADPDKLARLVANLDKLYTPGEEECADIDAKANAMKREADERMYRTPLAPDEHLQVHEQSMSSLKLVCPSLSRDTCAGILDIIANADNPVPVQSDLSFIFDTLFCEWAYVVDIDAGVLEAYTSARPVEGGSRFHEIDTVVGDQGPAGSGTVRGPGLMGRWPLANLPSEADFVRDINSALEESKEEYALADSEGEDGDSE